MNYALTDNTRQGMCYRNQVNNIAFMVSRLITGDTVILDGCRGSYQIDLFFHAEEALDKFETERHKTSQCDPTKSQFVQYDKGCLLPISIDSYHN